MSPPLLTQKGDCKSRGKDQKFASLGTERQPSAAHALKLDLSTSLPEQESYHFILSSSNIPSGTSGMVLLDHKSGHRQMC